MELPIPDYREGFGGPVGEPSANLFAVLNQSIRKQDWYRGYAQDHMLPKVTVVASAAKTSATAAAEDIRTKLDFEVQERFGNGSAVRKHLIDKFEEIGGLTVVTSMVDNNTHRPLDEDEFRGFSLVDEYAPLVFVNARQTLNGQIFTLAHEFAHVWLGSGGISREDPAQRSKSEIEQWCNTVASEVLVPSEDLKERYPGMSRLELAGQLKRLSEVYRCGTLVILQAIRRNRLIEFDDFESVYDAEVQRLASHKASEVSGGGNFYYNQNYRIGARFARAVIGDALEGRTELSEAMRLTSLRALNVFDSYAKLLGF